MENIYWSYLKQLLKHKKYVFQVGLKVGNIPLWRLIVHDWQKFTPQEFPHYARWFFGGKQLKHRNAFMYAWLDHVHHGKHHWEHWLLNPTYHFGSAVDGKLPMPKTYIREMVADWMGASKGYTGSWDMTEWLDKNLPRIEENMAKDSIEYLHQVLRKSQKEE